VTSLAQALARYHRAVIRFPPGEALNAQYTGEREDKWSGCRGDKSVRERRTKKATGAHNEQLAERLLSGRFSDDFVIAVDQGGWQLTPKSPALTGERWAMVEGTPLCPSWAMSLSEQEHAIRRSVAATTGYSQRKLAENA
jgi:hypothetical protein